MSPASSSSSSTKSSSSKKKRRNLVMRVVENAKRRRVTFAKRRQGLFSKAEELGAVCSADVAVVAFTSCGKAFSSLVDATVSWPSSHHSPMSGDAFAAG
ncbi:hypothetical protein C4D60_Mb01t29980 [Musa balbisiana]|uniref:MADS-box domain-containing protein n=1 Tax=Musa balbisiana TaxID=52838 RepID=A0A4S8JRR1_MUSBA|nr:hypothetical protein C4D60_Mb01t29980 [Musa balbisiana]